MPTSLYVGIDLGTTFTGVAYTFPPSKTIHTVRRWPGSDKDEPKVPTRLFYCNKELLGWGFADPRNTVTTREFDWQTFSVVEGFKLEIDPTLDIQSGSTRKKQSTPSETSRWYKDFLHSLFEHIEALLGSTHPKEWSQEVEFTFSVPNLYGPHIIAKFRDCLTDAGFGGGRHHISTVSLTESQAAVVYASHSLAIFKNNDLVLVCDAGGGTTDCGLLRIVQEVGGRLQMEEVIPAFGYTGMRIGSTDIDHAIRDSYLSWLQKHSWAKPVLWPHHNIDCQIEDYKISFTANTHSHLLLNITGYPEVQIDSLEIEKIFDTSVAGIFQGINAEMKLLTSTGMLEADNLYVVLCGGLGSSQYVRARMTELLSRYSVIPHACVIDIQEPQLVVAKGLVAERMWATADSRETWMEDSRKSPNGSKPHAEKSDDRTGVSYMQYFERRPTWGPRPISLGRRGPSRAAIEIADDGSDSISDALERYNARKEWRQSVSSATPSRSSNSPEAGRFGFSNELESSLPHQSPHGTEASSARDRLEARLILKAPPLPPVRLASSTLNALATGSTGIPSDKTTLGIQTVRNGARITSSRSSESQFHWQEFLSTYDESQGFGDKITLLQLERLDNTVVETAKSLLPYPERIVRWVENGSSPHGSGILNKETKDWLKRRHLNAGTWERLQEQAMEENDNDVDNGTANDDLSMSYEAVVAGEKVETVAASAAQVYLSQTSLEKWRSQLTSRRECETCKMRHLRCDGGFPSCVNCMKDNYFCDYNGHQPMRRVTENALRDHSADYVHYEYRHAESATARPVQTTCLSDQDVPSNQAEPQKVSSKPAVEIKTPLPQKSIFSKRRCRVSYGVLKLELYDESKHLRQDVWRFPLNNKLYVENIIEWVIKQGEEIDDEWTARFLCQKMLSNSERDDKKYIFQTHLVTSNKKAHQLPKSMTQGGAEALCNIEADLSAFPLSEFEKHVHKLGVFKKSKIYYLVKYHVAASSSPADIIFEVLFRGKSAEHRVERRVLWHDLSQPVPATLTPDVGSLSLVAE